MKPRLANDVYSLWEQVAGAAKHYLKYGYHIEIDTLGELGILSIDKDNTIYKMTGTKKLPTREELTNSELYLLDKLFLEDKVEIWAKRSGKSLYSGDSYPDYHLHSCSGLSFNGKVFPVRHNFANA